MKAFGFGIEIGKHIKHDESIIDLIEKGMKAEDHKPVEIQRIDLNSLLPTDEPFRSIATSVSGGDVENAISLVKKAAADGISGLTIATNGLLKGMDVVSTLYNNKQAYVPEILLAAKALDAGLKECGSLDALKGKGTVIVHTAEGDLHDIGKNIVAAIVAANGYRVIDLGTSVDSGSVVEAIREHRPIAVLGSSLMTSTRGAFIET
ncbi:MAG: cobalamin-dependent protein, partial [Methanotrichaceae archaeon]